MPSVVIVGGGITGAFTAYFLARLGAQATLLERDEIGAHASGNNPGCLNPLHGAGIPGPLQELALEAYRLHLANWEAVREHSGIDFSPRPKARLNLAMGEQDAERLGRAKILYDAAPGFSAEWLSRDDVLAMEPRLTPAITGALRVSGDARVDSAAYTRAVAAAALRLGAQAVRAEANGLIRSGPRAIGVRVDAGSLPCDAVVIASGPWCAGPSGWLGTALPVTPVKGEMLLVQAPPVAVEADLAWRDAAIYGSPHEEVWLGGTEELAGFDETPSAAARASIRRRVGEVLPDLASAPVLEHIAGLRPVTPDGLPIVGLSPGSENVWLALGAGRKGVLLSAAIALATAELVTGGGTTMPIDACSPARSWPVTDALLPR